MPSKEPEGFVREAYVAGKVRKQPRFARLLTDHRVGCVPFFKGRGAMPDSRMVEPHPHEVMKQTRRDRLGKDGQFVDVGDAIYKKAVNKGLQGHINPPAHAERRVSAGVGCGSYSNRARKGLLAPCDFVDHPTYSEAVLPGYEARRAAKAVKIERKRQAHWGR